MATVYIDPSAASNGSGSLGSPRNTYAGLTISSNDIVLQKIGTTYSGTITIPVGAINVTLGIYNDAGAQITDGSAYAKVNANGQQYGIRVRETSHGYRIIGFDVYGANSATQNWAFYLGNTASQVANNGLVRHCIARDTGSDNTADSGGVKWFGSGVTIDRVISYNHPTDAFFGQGNNCIVSNTRSWDIGLDGRDNGDNIQLTGNATLGCANAKVENNYCDHLSGNHKQAINIQDTTGGSVGGLISGNTVLMPALTSEDTNGIYADCPNLRIVGNYVYGAKHGIFCASNNAIVCGNDVVDVGYGLYQKSTATGGKFICNTVRRASLSGIYADTDTTFSATNNILHTCVVGVSKHGSATENYNCYYGNTTDQTNLAGTPAWGANNVMSNPLLNGALLSSGSPCIGAGVFTYGAFHRGGKRMSVVSPDIGAYRYFSGRVDR